MPSFCSLRVKLFGGLFMALMAVPGQIRIGHAAPPVALSGDAFTSIGGLSTDTTSSQNRRIRKSLDSFYQGQVARGFNGSVLVGYKGQILYERYFGFADKARGVLLSRNTPGQLASTSKPFLSTVIMWLYQNRYLDIDQPVQKYLKTFPYPGITVKMLMEQRSGLPEYTNFAAAYWKGNQLRSNRDLLALFAKVKPRLEFMPNTRFRYRNSNYALLALVVEEVTNKPYPEFMKEFVFKPLGMNHTFVYDPIHDPEGHPNKTISYRGNWAPWGNMFADGIYGDKNIYSTVEDMYKWDQSFYKRTLLNPRMQQMAYTGYSNDIPGLRNYGFGWRMLDYPDGYKVIYHNGWWHGNNNVFYRFIRDNFTIIVLGNRMNDRIYDQAKEIYQIVQGGTQRPGIQFDTTD